MTAPDPKLDALAALARYQASPSLTVLREITEGRDSFTLTHEPMEAPKLPPAPERVRAGKVAHRFDGLRDLGAFIESGAHDDGAVAFYNAHGVTVCLDEDSETEREVVKCGLLRHPSFLRWLSVAGELMELKPLLAFLRLNGGAIRDPGAEYLVGAYAAVRGELVHEAEEFLDHQQRSATFTVRRKVRGTETPSEVEATVPTSFEIAVPILIDDEEPTPFEVMVSMSAGERGAILFRLDIVGLDELVDDHVDDRLREFATSVSCSAFRGEWREEAWAQPDMPKSLETLLKLQRELIAAGVEG